MASKLPKYTVPSLSPSEGAKVAEVLQNRLHALNDLALTLKHIHWNVVCPHFIAVHEILDPQFEVVLGIVDEVAERISTLVVVVGGTPVALVALRTWVDLTICHAYIIATLGVEVRGTPGALVAERTWDDYSIGRADTIAHLGALDLVYRGIITDHREAAAETEEDDPVTNDLLIGQLAKLELFHWFV